jgi:hypothetical protein
MTHTVSTPPPNSGGGSREANVHQVEGGFVWNPPHDMSPREERRRTEKAERLFNEGKAMLNAPYTPMHEHDE